MTAETAQVKASQDWPVGEPHTRHEETVGELVVRPTRSGSVDIDELDPTMPLGPFFSAMAVGPLWVVVELSDVEGRVEPTRIEIRGVASGRASSAFPLSTTAIRRIRFGEAIDKAKREYREAAAWLAERLDKKEADELVLEALETARAHVASSNLPRPRVGRRRIEELPEFMPVVQAYRDAVRLGVTHEEIAERYHMTADNVAKYVRRARDIGELPQTTRGRKKA